MWRFSSVFSLCMFSSNFSSSFSFLVPLSWPVSLFLTLCSDFSLLTLFPSADIAGAARTHARRHISILTDAHRQSLAEISWPIWAVHYFSWGLCVIVQSTFIVYIVLEVVFLHVCNTLAPEVQSNICQEAMTWNLKLTTFLVFKLHRDVWLSHLWSCVTSLFILVTRKHISSFSMPSVFY